MKTESEIENLLRQAPAPAPSPELGGKLKNAVHLPQSTNGTDLNLGGAFWRRWLPAIGYAVMVLGCVVVLAVQNHRQSAVVQQLEKLREDITLKEQQIEMQRDQTRLALAADARIKSLQDNATEADQLAATLAELQALIAKLTTEATDLEAKLAVVPDSNEVIAPYDFFNDPNGPMQKAREEVDSTKCVNNMKRIGLAFRIFSNDNDGLFPPNFNSMANELSQATVLCCPKDESNRMLAERLFDFVQPNGPKDDWSDWKAAWARWPINGGSYEMLGANLNRNDPVVDRKIVAKCRFHGHVTYGNGAVIRGDTLGGLQP